MIVTLLNLRKKTKLSQTQVAQRLGTTQGAISQWEKGLTYPATDKILALANLYEVSSDEILKAIEK